MDQNARNIRSEDRKALKKFWIYIIAGVLLGGILGVGMAFVKFGDIDAVNKTLNHVVVTLFPASMIIVTFLVAIIVAIIYCKSRKAFRNWDGETEEIIEKVETRLSGAIWLTTMNTIWNYFAFGAVFCMNYWNRIENGETDSAMLLVGTFLIGLVLCIVEQQKIVNLEKEINPEKKGSIYDAKFHKVWEDSCDEAELLMIYKSGYKSYKVTQMLCLVLWTLCVLGGFIWDIGIVPVLIVAIVWATNVTSYTLEANRLSKKGGR